MSNTLIVLGTLATIGASAGGAIASIVTSKYTNRKLVTESNVAERKLPAEVDTIIAQAADTAVLAMDKVIKTQDARLTDMEAEREAMKLRMKELEAEVRTLRRQVEAAEKSLDLARKSGEELSTKLAQISAEQDRRHT